MAAFYENFQRMLNCDLRPRGWILAAEMGVAGIVIPRR